MIIGNLEQIGIQLEYIIEFKSPSGLFNFIIDDELIPGKGTITDLFMVISSLKNTFHYNLDEKDFEIGKKKIEDINFADGEPENLIDIDCSELSDYGCVFWLGYDGDEERLFYSNDFEKTFREQRYPKGTLANLIDSLPNSFDLKINRINDDITNTEIIS